MSSTVDSSGMLIVLLIAPERNGCAAAIMRRWPRQAIERPPPMGVSEQSNTGKMLGFEPGRAFDFALGVDVIDDLGDVLGRVAEPHQRLRHGVVDDLDHAAAHQPLLLHEREVGLDAGGIAIHHEADRARGSEHGDLRILVAELFAQFERRIPRFLRGAQQRRLHVFLLDRPQRIAMHANHVEHRLAVAR